ncbi:hypothetical protein BpHYR1_019032 [Brachionus plicatilis]|uniref:Uncharacterized protein n=1 Tax=Brachionus plicatilis TaxID=10195 RepID=A0A3M7SFR3_BRAPC|nr:hypothetical protein BpHYR1_019032 [Brachionus plicatilis]
MIPKNNSLLPHALTFDSTDTIFCFPEKRWNSLFSSSGNGHINLIFSQETVQPRMTIFQQNKKNK